MTDKYVKSIKDELKHKITANRQYCSLEKQEFANGLQQALDIIEKYERRDMRGDKETTFDDYLKEQLKDPEFRKEYEKLRDEDMRGKENENT